MIKSPDSYEIPWRPSYEARALAAWLAAAAACALLDLLTDLQPGLLAWTAAGCALMAASWVPGTLRVGRRLARLRGKPLTFITWETLERKRRRHPDRLWLGDGFEWGQREAQLLYEIVKRDARKLLPRPDDRMGAPWIHGLGADEKAIDLPLEHIEGHCLIVGTTRSGKTRLFDLLVSQAIARGEAVIIIDPKGDKDLRDNARRACERAGAPGRFVHFNPAHPERSARINPLANFARATELATRVATLVSSETGTDPFKAFGQMVLANLCQGLLLTDDHPSLVKFRHYVEVGPDTLVERVLVQHFEAHVPGWRTAVEPYLQRMKTQAGIVTGYIRFYREHVHQARPSTVVDGMVGMFEHNREHFGKMIASLMPVLNMLTSGDLGPLLSPNAADRDDHRPITNTTRIIESGQVLYLGLDSLSDGMVGSAIASMFAADLAAVAGARYNYGQDLKPVNVFVDESAEAVNDPLIQLLNKGGGARLRLFLATQTFADFAARTGSADKARQVLGNLNNLIALRVLDDETQKYIAENLPMTRVQYIMRTQAMSTHSANPLVFSGNHGERLMEEEAELFPAAMLGQLPNLEYIAKLSGGRIVKGRVPILT